MKSITFLDEEEMIGHKHRDFLINRTTVMFGRTRCEKQQMQQEGLMINLEVLYHHCTKPTLDYK